jgi:hypothetical protein
LKIPCRSGIELVYDEMVAAVTTPELASLAEAVEALELPAGPRALEEAIFLADRLAAKISSALGSFDEGQGWGHDGSLSLTAWAAYHGRMSRREAHREAVRARRLRCLPGTSLAWLEGRLSAGQVAAVLANVPERYLGLYAEQEAGLVAALEGLSAAEAAAVMRCWQLTPKPSMTTRPHLSARASSTSTAPWTAGGS